MNDPPTVMKLTSFVDTQVTVDTVGTNHAAPPSPPEPPLKVHHVAHCCQDLVYNIPTPKIHKCCQYLFPIRSMVDFNTLDHAPSPTTQFEFLVNPVAGQYYEDLIADLPDIPTMWDSVTRVTGQPRVCGLVGDACSTIQVMLLATIRASHQWWMEVQIFATQTSYPYLLKLWISSRSLYQWWLWVPMSRWINVALNAVSFHFC